MELQRQSNLQHQQDIIYKQVLMEKIGQEIHQQQEKLQQLQPQEQQYMQD